MTGLGHLVYGTDGKLAYRTRSGAGQHHLIFRTDGEDGICTVRVPWRAQHYTCHTYNQYHEVSPAFSGRFTSGSGSIISHTSAGAEEIFKLQVHLAAVFALSCGVQFSCASDEPGDIVCDVFADMRGASPKFVREISCPRGNNPTVVSIVFGVGGILEGIS